MTAEWWEWLFSAVALVMVIEGIIPFAMPDQWRNMLRRLIGYDNTKIRFSGFLCMFTGLILLVFVHHYL